MIEKKSKTSPNPLIAIVGPTASGKSALAMEIARQYQGEIIAADSRTIYRGMNIGTAKPSAADQAEIPHHLLDVVEPGEVFSVVQFQQRANQTIVEIESRDHLPIMVGGTGLYVDAVLYDYQFPTDTEAPARVELAKLSVAQLQAQVEELGVALNDSDWHNPRRLIRAIETAGTRRDRRQLRSNTLVLGMMVGREQLEQQIRQRVEKMVASGFIEEVRQLGQRYGWESEAMSGIGYQVFGRHVRGELSLEQAISDTVGDTQRLAKRQMTWFKRNQDIRWVSGADEGLEQAAAFLAKAV